MWIALSTLMVLRGSTLYYGYQTRLPFTRSNEDDASTSNSSASSTPSSSPSSPSSSASSATVLESTEPGVFDSQVHSNKGDSKSVRSSIFFPGHRIVKSPFAQLTIPKITCSPNALYMAGCAGHREPAGARVDRPRPGRPRPHLRRRRRRRLGRRGRRRGDGDGRGTHLQPE